MQNSSSLSVGILSAVTIFGKLAHLYYYEGITQFYPLAVAASQSPLIKGCSVVETLILAEQAFYALLWLLFGRFSPSEEEYLADVSWSVFAEFASTYVLFQPMISLTTGLHILFMYVLHLVSLLLAKRVEEVTTADRDALLTEDETEEEEDLLAFATSVRNNRVAVREAPSTSSHLRIALLISGLYLVNVYAITRYQWPRLRITSVDGRTTYYSLLVAATLNRYVISSAILFKTVANYLLSLIETAYFRPPANDWENRPIWSAVVEVLTSALVALSSCALVALTWLDGLRAISLSRLAARASARLVSAAQTLVGAIRATARLINFPAATAADIAREGLCAICLETLSLVVGEDCRRVPQCGHAFHYRCLKRWLQQAQVCPSCRTQL